MTAFYIPPSFGWHRRPDAVAATLRHLERTQPVSPYAGVSAAGLLAQADDDRPAAAVESRGSAAAGWRFVVGPGRRRHLRLVRVRSRDERPDAFAGERGKKKAIPASTWRPSRFTADRASRWAAVRFVATGRSAPGRRGGCAKWGVLLRQKYGSHDLTRYSVALSRAWGQTGVPDDLEPECRLHPVRTVAQVRRAEEAWRLLGNGYPVPVCSTVGFDSPLEDGFCAARGEWPHCMLLRGRLVARYRGTRVRAFCVQNSWGDYLRGEAVIRDADGNPVPLPPGCFGILWEDCEAILREGDSFALSDLVGFAPATCRGYCEPSVPALEVLS
ncbi:MAG: hypothetical protein U0736_19405 [Gemmataceae bacterium]